MLTNMDFGRPNAEIGQKMANGRLLFLALNLCVQICKHFQLLVLASDSNL